MLENSKNINCWRSINQQAKDKIVNIVGNNIDILRFDYKTDCDENIKEYRFEQCCFLENFTMSVDSSIKADFVFHDCSFKAFRCESNYVEDKEYSGVISLSETKHQGELKFEGSFKNRVHIDSANVSESCSINFSGNIDKDRCDLYNDIVIFRTNASIFLHRCDIWGLLIEDSESIEKLEIKDVSIKNKLSIINIDKCSLLRISNLDFEEGSKVLFENLLLHRFVFTKISQDVKYMQFNSVWVEESFLCEKVEFKNTYFNDFNIESAKKFISKTSFIDAHLNDVNWGDVSSVSANEATFRQLKFVNDSQGSHLIANQFYAMEMRKYQEEFEGNFSESLVLWLNKITSNFGQSYARPLILILVVGIIRSFTICGHENDWLYRICESLNPLFEGVARPLNSIAPSLLPISRFLGEGSEGREFIDLLFFIVFSILIWHLVVALKRHTKR